jgi:hypothetical protein
LHHEKVFDEISLQIVNDDYQKQNEEYDMRQISTIHDDLDDHIEYFTLQIG